MLPNIEWSFNAYTVGALIFTVSGFYWATKISMGTLEKNVVGIKDELQKLTELMRDVAVQKTELENLRGLVTAQAGELRTVNERLFKMAQGQGFMQRELDGEYTRKGKT